MFKLPALVMICGLAASWLTEMTEGKPVSHFLEVPVDHKNLTKGMYRMQYIVDDQYYLNNTGPEIDKPKPIFFYTGNEGSIWDFYDNSGFMTTTLAQEYGALVVFGEHRFFGQSWPFPQDIAFTSPYNTLLTVEQALADYVDLLKHIKRKYNAHHKATIGFGGSYGGMLAAWMRMKYPHVLQGSLAASAPILLFRHSSGYTPGGFAQIVSDDFNVTGSADDKCYLGMKDAFVRLITKAPLPDFPNVVNASFPACQTLFSSENVTSLVTLLRNGFFYEGMTDYPYPASFLEPMPAYPVNASCAAFANWTKDASDPAILAMLKNAADVYFDYKKDPDFCYDISKTEGTGTLAAGGWDVLACNELAMPQTNGFPESSIFVADNDTFDYEAYKEECQQKYNLTPNYEWAMNTFGGKQNYSQEYRQYSNIIFSNGNLDPWMAGGVVDYVSPKLPIYIIKGGAHHLDLRLPNEKDPADLKWVRKNEGHVIGGWIAAYQPEWSGYKGPSIYDDLDDVVEISKSASGSAASTAEDQADPSTQFLQG